MAHANEFLSRLARADPVAFARLPRSIAEEGGFRERRRFYATELLRLTGTGVADGVADRILPARARLGRTKRMAGAYLERLLRTNSSRVVFDVDARVEASRRGLESDLRRLLEDASGSAQRALDRARARHDAGRDAVDRELRALDDLQLRLAALTAHAGD